MEGRTGTKGVEGKERRRLDRYRSRWCDLRAQKLCWNAFLERRCKHEEKGLSLGKRKKKIV